MPPAPNRRLYWLRRAIIIVAVGAAAWHFIDFRELGTTLAGVKWPWLGALLALHSLDRFMMAGKWGQLLRAAGIRVRYGLVLGAYYQAAFLQRFLPSSLGGDALRAVVVTREHGRTSVVFASMVVEKLIAVFAALAIALAGASLVISEARDTDLRLILATVPVMLAVTLGALALSMHGPFVRWWLDRIPIGKVRTGIHKVYGDYRAFGGSPRVLFANFAFALAEQLLQVGILLGCALALSVDASVLTLLAAISISQCVRKFAIVLEGWALGEFTNVLVCTLLGIAEAQALAFSLLNHAIGLTAAIPGGVIFVRSAPSLKDLTSFTTSAPSPTNSVASPPGVGPHAPPTRDGPPAPAAKGSSAGGG